jgi:hypothetical protein
MLIQLPVFRVLLGADGKRGNAPGAIHRLAAGPPSRDPYFICPSSWLAPCSCSTSSIRAADPVQAKMMMILPLVMSATFTMFLWPGAVLRGEYGSDHRAAWNINRRIERPQDLAISEMHGDTITCLPGRGGVAIVTVSMMPQITAIAGLPCRHATLRAGTMRRT